MFNLFQREYGLEPVDENGRKKRKNYPIVKMDNSRRLKRSTHMV